MMMATKEQIEAVIEAIATVNERNGSGSLAYYKAEGNSKHYLRLLREQAEAAINTAQAPLLEAVRETVKAWDSLKMGHHQTADVQRWLLDNMAPAIAALRPFLESEGKDA